ncbi:MAG: type IV pilus assembly protein PilM [Planctomycetes bacterium]|nr:type IV pilus assembly protein PilM [Planctomycetota bacterium]
MAGYTTVWSVELGRSALKAVRMRREGAGLEILGFDRVEYEIGAEGIDVANQTKEALSIFHARNHVRDPIVACFPGQNAFSRFIKLPPLESRKLQDMIGYEAQQQIPFPIDEVIWDWHVVAREYLPGEEKEVGIFAVRREAIDDHLIDFSSAGMKVDMITLGYLGLLNFILYDIRPKEPSIFLDMGADHTDLLIVDGQNFWIRTLPSSGNEMTRALSARFQLSFAEAERLKRTAAQKADQAAKIFQAIQPNLRDLVNEIHRSVGFYKSQAGEVKLDTVYLLGNGARLIGAKKFLQESLGATVTRVGSLSRVRLGPEVDVAAARQEIAGLATAVGGAIQGCGRGAVAVNLIPQEQKVQIEFARKRKMVFVALGVLVLFLGLLGLSYQKANSRAVMGYDEASPLAKKLRRLDGQIKDARKATGVEARIDRLKGVGANRLEPVAALRMIDDLFVKTIKTGEAPEATVTEADAATALENLNIAANDENAKKVWLLGLDVESLPYRVGDEVPGQQVAAGTTAARAREGIPSIGAVRVRISGAVEMKQNEADSLAFVKEKLAPLQKQIFDRLGVPAPEAGASPDSAVGESPSPSPPPSGEPPADVDPEVQRRGLLQTMGTLQYDTGSLVQRPQLYVDMGEAIQKARSSAREEVVQGSFYLFRVSFFLTKEDPLALIAKPAEPGAGPRKQ